MQHKVTIVSTKKESVVIADAENCDQAKEVALEEVKNNTSYVILEEETVCVESVKAMPSETVSFLLNLNEKDEFTFSDFVYAWQSAGNFIAFNEQYVLVNKTDLKAFKSELKAAFDKQQISLESEVMIISSMSEGE